MNAVFDAHRDDPEFGYRFLADEVKDAGFTVWSARCGKSARPTARGTKIECKESRGGDSGKRKAQ